MKKAMSHPIGLKKPMVSTMRFGAPLTAIRPQIQVQQAQDEMNKIANSIEKRKRF
jgi:hypothetical protein